MTSIFYSATPPTNRPSQRVKNAKKPAHTDTTSTAKSSGGLFGLGNSLRLREQPESKIADDSIEAQYLDMISCSANRCMNMNSSIITYNTAANTSSEESLLSCPETNTSGEFPSCFSGESDAISSITPKKSHDEFSLEDLEEDVDDDDDDESIGDLREQGWVPRAVSDAWDNVVSSNWQCWQGTTEDLHEPSPIRGKEKKPTRDNGIRSTAKESTHVLLVPPFNNGSTPDTDSSAECEKSSTSSTAGTSKKKKMKWLKGKMTRN